MTEQDRLLVERIQKLGLYQHIRMLEDGTIVAVRDLIFTRAIYFDCDLFGWHKRFCYKDPDLAIQEYLKIQSCDTEPQGWIATRGSQPEYHAPISYQSQSEVRQ